MALVESADEILATYCGVQQLLEVRHPRPDRGTSLIRNSALLGPYSRALPRALWLPQGGGVLSCE